MDTVVVLGSTISDLVARAPRLPGTDEAVIGDDFSTFLGGKGFNQAVAVRSLGALPSLPTTEDVQALLQEANVG